MNNHKIIKLEMDNVIFRKCIAKKKQHLKVTYRLLDAVDG